MMIEPALLRAQSFRSWPRPRRAWQPFRPLFAGPQHAHAPSLQSALAAPQVRRPAQRARLHFQCSCNGREPPPSGSASDIKLGIESGRASRLIAPLHRSACSHDERRLTSDGARPRRHPLPQPSRRCHPEGFPSSRTERGTSGSPSDILPHQRLRRGGARRWRPS